MHSNKLWLIKISLFNRSFTSPGIWPLILIQSLCNKVRKRRFPVGEMNSFRELRQKANTKIKLGISILRRPLHRFVCQTVAVRVSRPGEDTPYLIRCLAHLLIVIFDSFEVLFSLKTFSRVFYVTPEPPLQIMLSCFTFTILWCVCVTL